MVAPIRDENPKWLQLEPDGQPPAPPIQGRQAQVPFTALEWKNFERLCCRLAGRAGNVERVWSYGTAGQAQFGIDILVRLSDGRYEVWQTKRYKSIKPSDISAAIALFLDHSWASKASRFILAVACDLDSTGVIDAVETAADQLSAKSIEFAPLDGARLSALLISEPEIVDDFFGRAWAEAICPPEAREVLASRISRFDRNELRASLRRCYSSWISTVDPGLPIAGLDQLGRSAPAIPLGKRFVAPDLLINAAPPYTATPRIDESGAQYSAAAASDRGALNGIGDERSRPESARSFPVSRRQRVDLNRFLGTERRAIISGDAGAGKSTLLRAVALDLLSDEPQLSVAQGQFAGFIPVWVPFALWTRMALERTTPPSINDVVAAFLEAQGEHTLANEMRRVLNTSKILLLIDGLDEASDSTAARTIAALVAAHAESNESPVLVTTRPHGLRTIAALMGSWTKAELAPLSDVQRHSLAKLWFKVLESLEIDGQASKPSRLDAQAEHRARNLMSALARNPGMAKLSQTPLFLLALMELHRHGRELPRSRFAAIERIVEQLVEHQPRRRETEALSTMSAPAGSARLRDKLLDDFAFALQTGELTGSVPDAAVEQSAIARGSDIVLERRGGQDRDAAEASAREVFAFAEERAGLLVKKAIGTIGFLHLSIQEFLSARYLTQLPFAKRVEFVGRHCELSRWHETILYLLYLTKNEGEVGDFIRAIKEAEVSSVRGAYSREALLTNAVFADFAHDIAVALDAANQLLDSVESTSWGEHKRHILLSTIDGLASEAVAGLCERRIRRWVPNYHGYARGSAIRAMATWPLSSHSECKAVLLRSLSADEDSTWRAAAEVLPRLNGLETTRDALQRLVRVGASVELLTSSLYALGCGWSAEPKVGEIAITARTASDPAVRIEAIRIRAKRNEADDEDFEEFFEQTFRRGDFLDRVPNRDLITYFVSTKRVSLADRLVSELKSITDRRTHTLKVLIAGLVLCDPDHGMIQPVMRELLSHRWMIRDIFARSAFPADKVRWTPELTAEIERFVQAEGASHSDYELYWIAKILPLPSIKAQILRNLAGDSYFRFWSAEALVEVWGASDPDVRNALVPFLTAGPSDIASLASVLPKIVEDKSACREAALRSIRGNPTRVDLLFQAMRAIGISQGDEDLYAACLETGNHRRSPLYHDQWREGMILTFPRRSEVRELALTELQLRNAEVGAVAESYGADAEVRTRLLDVLSPLDKSARLVLVQGLQAMASTQPVVTKLLQNGTKDTSGSVATEATVGWMEALVAAHKLTDAHIDELTNELHAVGPSYQEQRAAALIGLAIAGRLDRFSPEVEAKGEPLKIRTTPGVGESDRYIRRILHYWPQFVAALGDEQQAIARLEIEPETVLPLLDPTQPNVEGLFEYLLKQVPSRQHFAKHQHLSILARFAPGSSDLRQKISDGLTGNRNREYAEGLLAAELFAENFAGDEELRRKIVEAFDRDPQGPAAAALAELVIRRRDTAAERILREKVTGLSFDVATHFKLVAALSSPERVVENLKNASRVDEPYVSDVHLKRWVPAIVRRIEHDGRLRATMIESLGRESDATTKVSFVSLLLRAGGADDQLREFASTELKRVENDVIATIGFDLVSGTHRIARQVMIEALV